LDVVVAAVTGLVEVTARLDREMGAGVMRGETCAGERDTGLMSPVSVAVVSVVVSCIGSIVGVCSTDAADGTVAVMTDVG
jgi:hypothetical protein